MRPALNADGTKYYEIVLLYTNNVLVISENSEKLLHEHIGKYFELKKELIGPPKIYLGGKMHEVTLEDDVCAWAFGSSQYAKAAVENIEGYLKKIGSKLPTKAETPIQTSCCPELDVLDESDTRDAAYFQSLVRIFCWMVELGRINICLKVSMLSCHLAMPREGHLHQLFHIFAYLKKYHNSELVFDPSVPEIDEEAFARKDWSSSEFGQ
eukprot:10491078-Ditylum_brightwellii.AAC.1